MRTWLYSALVLVLIIIGGVFSAAEIALVSLRESQVTHLEHRGRRGSTIAKLARDPNRFLSAVQIGVTLAGFLSAAFGGATLAEALSPHLVRLGLSPSVAATVALVLVTLLISYVSIVLGELTAKRLAMQSAEGFALALAPLVNTVATGARPVIWLLGRSTDVVVRLLGGDPRAGREQVSDEEIRAMVLNSQTLGTVERQIVDDVFDAGERSLREVMVPRTEVDFLPGDMPAYKAVRTVHGAEHSRYPVTDRSTDQILGFVHVRDLMDLDPVNRTTPVRQLVRPVMALPETVKVLRALSEMRRASAHLAIVKDEYGGTSGIVTLEDLVEELIGDITDEYDQPVAGSASHGQRNDIDGLTTLEDFADRFGYVLPEGPYDTVAGYVMAQLGHVPELGDSVEVDLHRVAGPNPLNLPDRALVRFSVTELDGRRAAWIVVTRVGEEPAPTEVDAPSGAVAE
ncbi:MAG TPA: hemolysin family protein [Propionibacteriaceae bacterium]|nr:hemolysin family protein [Propionibacteriaceae bacterium]